MFWESVKSGLEVLLHWQTYVAGLEYAVISYLPVILASWGLTKGSRAGCLFLILTPAVQTIAIIVFVLTMSPILLGVSDKAAWGFPLWIILNEPGAFLILASLLVFIIIIFAFVPLLGGLDSLNTLIVGGSALILVLSILKSANPDILPSEFNLMPNFWFLAGLVAIGGGLSWVGLMVAAITAASLGKLGENFGFLLMTPLAMVFRFIPTFIYGAYLGMQLKSGG